jgi:hypothetical protein
LKKWSKKNAPAKITSTRLRPSPMVITSEIHVPIRATTSPPKPLRPVCIKLLLVATVLDLELGAVLVRFVGETMSPACAFLFARPGDEFKTTFVQRLVLAFAVLVVPFRLGGVIAYGFVDWPVLGLTADS